MSLGVGRNIFVQLWTNEYSATQFNVKDTSVLNAWINVCLPGALFKLFQLKDACPYRASQWIHPSNTKQDFLLFSSFFLCHVRMIDGLWLELVLMAGRVRLVALNSSWRKNLKPDDTEKLTLQNVWTIHSFAVPNIMNRDLCSDKCSWYIFFFFCWKLQ